MKIMICDDQADFLSELSNSISSVLKKLKVEAGIISFSTSERALNYMKTNRDTDIVFMDILLGDENGFEVAKCISNIAPKSKIIFLSSTSAYALKGYDIKASRYLMKPLKKAKLECVLKDEISEIRNMEKKYIVEKNDLGIFKIFFDEILYIDTFERNTLIHTTNGNYISYKNMREQESRLKDNFVRCHASYIVNLEHVKSYSISEIQLQNNEKIWVSKGKRKEFLHALTIFYGKYLN